MNCEQIQPDLLDYGKGKLSGPEARRVRAHLQKCAKCTALLEEEMSFSVRLATLPEEKPINDVWELVRARTKPKLFRPLAWLRSISSAPGAFRKMAAAATAAIVLVLVVYGFISQPNVKPFNDKQHVADKPAVTLRWSDDPLGNHTDAVVEFISNM